jgi:hypothetical protein
MLWLSERARRSALDRAEKALQEMEKNQSTQRALGILARLAVLVVIVLAVSGLAVHTFFEQHRPQVDSTTVALLAVALIAPFVPRLKALEVGGAVIAPLFREWKYLGSRIASLRQAAKARSVPQSRRSRSGVCGPDSQWRLCR